MLADAEALWEAVHPWVSSIERGQKARLDLSRVERADGAAMAVIMHAHGLLHARSVNLELLGADAGIRELIRIYRDGEVPVFAGRLRKPENLLSCIGHGTVDLAREVQLGLAFLGSFVVAVYRVVRRPQSANWREVWPIMESAGADAVPIVLVINFLIGFVTAYQAAVELRRFGATIYVADLVGVSITRELGPIMTAIIVTGRSGAAFAAELGSMKVSEEIDALHTLGLDPLRFLVFPRVFGLLLVVPLLTLLADGIGILGGLAVSARTLDIGPRAYLAETQSIVFLDDIFSGLAKSLAFAMAVGLIACQQGLAASGGAAGVGRRTTSSVVSILFALILIDAFFTLVFHKQHV